MSPAKKKRIFMAIPISGSVQKAALRWEKKFKKLPVRWISGKNLHITLIPPWYAADTGRVVKKLSKLKARPFIISFELVKYGPEPKHPRLIWAEGKAPEDLIRLKGRLEKVFPAHKSTHKEFILHMTIARFEPEKFKKFPVKKLDKQVNWKQRIDSFVLMESHLSREGADYEVLETFKLFT